MDVAAVEVLPKALQYSGTLLALGVAGAWWLEGRADAPRAMWSRLPRVARAAAVLLGVGAAARLAAHAVVAFGPADAFAAENLRLLVVDSRWGAGFRWQALAAASVAATSMSLGPSRFRGWPLFSLAAAAAAMAIPLLGHAAGAPSRVALHAAHVVAAGAWLGTLAVFVLTGVGRPQASPADAAADRRLVARFSPVALGAAALVALSGGVAAWAYLDGFTSLATTTYGRALILKLALVGVVAACGLANWRRVRRGDPPDRRVLAVEASLATLVVLVTAALTETEHP